MKLSRRDLGRFALTTAVLATLPVPQVGPAAAQLVLKPGQSVTVSSGYDLPPGYLYVVCEPEYVGAFPRNQPPISLEKLVETAGLIHFLPGDYRFMGPLPLS